MNTQRLIELSQVSNAVLTGEMVVYNHSQFIGHQCKIYDAPKPVSEKEQAFRERWCKRQLSSLRFSESTAVLGSGQ
ncbi:hypothetical protein [Acinetobacter sp. HY1485]|uniref:hypothetical protein n=1 Tax=Acinetobacter sp. HY1485 TaxID=2970918 RepID=UPI0022B97D4D|nr:hypothetical protein [Acinetobacter sp. HY1485]